MFLLEISDVLFTVNALSLVKAHEDKYKRRHDV